MLMYLNCNCTDGPLPDSAAHNQALAEEERGRRALLRGEVPADEGEDLWATTTMSEQERQRGLVNNSAVDPAEMRRQRQAATDALSYLIKHDPAVAALFNERPGQRREAGDDYGPLLPTADNG